MGAICDLRSAICDLVTSATGVWLVPTGHWCAVSQVTVAVHSVQVVHELLALSIAPSPQLMPVGGVAADLQLQRGTRVSFPVILDNIWPI